MPHNNSSSHPPKKRRERNIRIRDVRKPEPDLQRIAEVIFSTIMEATNANQTMEEYAAANKLHREYETALRNEGFEVAISQALPNCPCYRCKSVHREGLGGTASGSGMPKSK